MPGALRAKRSHRGGVLPPTRDFGRHIFAVAPERTKRRRPSGGERAAFCASLPDRVDAGGEHVGDGGGGRGDPLARRREAGGTNRNGSRVGGAVAQESGFDLSADVHARRRREGLSVNVLLGRVAVGEFSAPPACATVVG